MKRRSTVKRMCTAVLVILLAVCLPVGAHAAGLDSFSRRSTLPKDEADLFDIFSEVKSWIEEFSPRYSDMEDLYLGAIKGMVESLGDPYSQYLTPEQYDSLTSSLQGEYVGIGVTIDYLDGQITIINAFKGSPAEKAGLKAGDVIVGVDGADMRAKTSLDAQAVLRGMPDTSVSVEIWRPSDNSVFSVKLVRSVINQDYIDVEDLGDGLHYIYLSQFTENVSRNFGTVIDFLYTKDLKGLVLDLRDNPGGYLDACIEIADHLVPKGTVVELRRGEVSESLESEGLNPQVPIVVLVNGGSASASEILAGAIRDRGVGILVGERTFGKACVQTVASLGEYGGVRLTIADYYTPSGFSLAVTGLAPDIEARPVDLDLPIVLDYTRPLTYGSVGLDVLALQDSLTFLGYEPGGIDGVFGGLTESALSRLLADRGAEWSGSFEQSDLKHLNAAILDKTLSAPDTVKQTAVRVLRERVASGSWLKSHGFLP